MKNKMGAGDMTGEVSRTLDLLEWLGEDRKRYAVQLDGTKPVSWRPFFPVDESRGQPILMVNEDANYFGNIELLFGRFEKDLGGALGWVPTLLGVSNPVYLSTWSPERTRLSHPGGILLPSPEDQESQRISYGADTVYLGNETVLDALENQTSKMMIGTHQYANMIRTIRSLE